MDSPVTERIVGLPNLMGSVDLSFGRQFMRDSQGPQPLTNIYFNSTTIPGGGPFSFETRETSITSSVESSGSFSSILDDIPALEFRSPSPLGTNSDRQSPSPVLAAASLPDPSDLMIQPDPVTSTTSRKRKISTLKPLPAAAVAKPKLEDDLKPAAKLPEQKDVDDDDDGNCIICLCDPDPEDLAKINGCDHQFCFDCIEQWSERENTCPLCKNRFTKIDRVNKSKTHKAEDVKKKNSKSVKTRDQRTMEGLRVLAGMHGLGPVFIQDSIGYDQSGPQRIHHASNRRTIRYRTGRLDARRGFPRSQHLPSYQQIMFAVQIDGPIIGTFPAMAAVPDRSHAVNGDDRTAGETAQNALEIADDSEDEDDVIEVVDVRRGRAV
mmetsp:Transcript_28857/g.40798  ORF Transcript_28857/g.40798 Transcript_28857/m.40798 type:complete len:380 (-) Transcript_28857:1295-2434(-)|eukprot:CAMPEP_0202475882 /NCGR_PEP_ID=MMETSP1360-20130828/93133_1 /ASSEMBLY_ACC=CAM_ASM_000848 /TAXON_ID=515479 /ORGANISM="Licmophora paradoxa, Strain CCMP2313" /LENGTH=379 /DNA_ID=CAMNT_0049103063 /DNA_START=725 /DNA_END=1864 /DNA_ORIENTATION=+